MTDNLLHFIVEQAELQPARKRIEIYRDLIETLPANHEHRPRLLALVEQLEQLEMQTRQILLELR